MAGIYPDIPGIRFALDQDGTIAQWRNSSTQSNWVNVTSQLNVTQSVSTASSIAMNLAGAGYQAQIALAFPEARDITGMYLHLGFVINSYSAAAPSCWYSTDTQDGTDGTWTSFTPSFALYGSHSNISHSSKPYYRSDIAPLALAAVKGLRIGWILTSGGNPNTSHALFVLHLYGTYANTSSRLDFRHPTLDQAASHATFDFGDIQQGVSATKQFRIKNLSGSQTANGISVSFVDFLPEYGTGDLLLSTDNSTFASSISIGNLASGATSPILYVKRNVPTGQAAGLRFARVVADATTWS